MSSGKKNKKALIMAGTHNDLGLIASIKKMGYYTICIGNIEGLPGQGQCDEYVPIDYSNANDVLEFAKEKEITNVIPTCNDTAVITACYVDNNLGINNLDNYDTIRILHNKDLFKKYISKFDIFSAKSDYFNKETEAKSFIKNIQYPIIIKPVDSSGGKGINKCNSYLDGEKAIEYAFQNSKCKRIIIEEFIDGTQHGFSTFLVDKKVVAICTNDEFSFENKYRVEIDTFPSSNYNAVSKYLIDKIEFLANKLELKDGIFHLQYIYKNGKPYLIEVMRRIVGNMYHVLGNILTNRNWELMQAEANLGIHVNNTLQIDTQNGFFAYKTIFAEKNGKIKSITIPDAYRPYMFKQYYLYNIGDSVDQYEKTQIGFLFFKFPNKKTMDKILIDEYRNDIVSID